MSNTRTVGDRPKVDRRKTFDLDALEKEASAPKPLPEIGRASCRERV